MKGEGVCFGRIRSRDFHHGSCFVQHQHLQRATTKEGEGRDILTGSVKTGRGYNHHLYSVARQTQGERLCEQFVFVFEGPVRARPLLILNESQPSRLRQVACQPVHTIALPSSTFLPSKSPAVCDCSADGVEMGCGN